MRQPVPQRGYLCRDRTSGPGVEITADLRSLNSKARCPPRLTARVAAPGARTSGSWPCRRRPVVDAASVGFRRGCAARRDLVGGLRAGGGRVPSCRGRAPCSCRRRARADARIAMAGGALARATCRAHGNAWRARSSAPNRVAGEHVINYVPYYTPYRSIVGMPRCRAHCPRSSAYPLTYGPIVGRSASRSPDRANLPLPLPRPRLREPAVERMRPACAGSISSSRGRDRPAAVPSSRRAVATFAPTPG